GPVDGYRLTVLVRLHVPRWAVVTGAGSLDGRVLVIGLGHVASLSSVLWVGWLWMSLCCVGEARNGMSSRRRVSSFVSRPLVHRFVVQTPTLLRRNAARFLSLRRARLSDRAVTG